MVPRDREHHVRLHRNHISTHVLKFGLREVPCDHVDQRGSRTSSTKLPFNFIHKDPLSPPKLPMVEALSQKSP